MTKGKERVGKINIMERKLTPCTSARAWEIEIRSAAEGRVPVYTDGCVNKSGSAGFGWAGADSCGRGGLRAVVTTPTALDCEIAGIRDALERCMPDSKILVLSDSKAAIAALVTAGKTGKARTHDVARAIEAIRERQERLGEDAVVISWVKAHIGIVGNEMADAVAKLGAEEETQANHANCVRTT